MVMDEYLSCIRKRSLTPDGMAPLPSPAAPPYVLYCPRQDLWLHVKRVHDRQRLYRLALLPQLLTERATAGDC
jgi:hypothetical protein